MIPSAKAGDIRDFFHGHRLKMNGKNDLVDHCRKILVELRCMRVILIHPQKMLTLEELG